VGPKEYAIIQYNHDQNLIALTEHDGISRLDVYQLGDFSLVLGRASSVEKELWVEKCLEDKIPMYRRSGGGCAVLIDPGNIIVAATMCRTGQYRELAIKKIFTHFADWLINAFEIIGIHGLVPQGISDLTLNNMKVGGACLYIGQRTLYFSTTVLVSPNIELMGRYLKHPPREPAYRQGRKHADFVAGLTAIYPGLSAAQLKMTLERVLRPPQSNIP